MLKNFKSLNKKLNSILKSFNRIWDKIAIRVFMLTKKINIILINKAKNIIKSKY